MRIAVAGKGGVGKTTFSATFARLAAQGGARVVAVDADSNPNLAVALGVPAADREAAVSLPQSIVSRRLVGPALATEVDEVLDRYALRAPDGVSLLRMGMPQHAEEGCLCSAHAVVSAVLAALGDRPEVVTLLDLEASPEHLGRGTARHADVLLFVTEPYYRSLETVTRMATLAAELPIPRVGVVVNKVRSRQESEAVAEFCERHGLERIGEIPWSEDVVQADVDAVPLVDRSPDGAVVAAVTAIATALRTPAVLAPTPGGV